MTEPMKKLQATKQALDLFDENHRNTPEAREAFAKYMQAGKELNDIFSTWAGAKGAISIGNESVGMTRQLTGLAAGTKDTDAVNVAQLKALANAPMNFYFGGKKEGNVYTPGAKNWTMPLSEFRMAFGDGLKAEQVTDKDGKKYTRVTLDKQSLKNDPAFKGPKGDQGPTGKDGAVGPQGPKGPQGNDGAKGDTGAKGADGKSAYDIWKAQPGNDGKSQDDFMKSLKGKDGKDGTNGKSAFEIWENHTAPDGTQPNKGKSEADFLKSLKGKDGAGAGGGTDFTVTSDDTKPTSNFKVDSDNPKLKIAGDKTNITTSIEKDNTVKVALKQDIKVNSVEVGAKNGKSGVKIDGDGINMNGKQIKNLAPGTAPNDAATVGQVNEVRNESREGNAMNAALAALKPLDFDPYNRSQIMAGVSTYRDKQAVALGLAHYSNEDTLVHAGIAYGGNSELMANAGISWRFGDKDDRDARAQRNARMPQYADGPISSVYVMQDEMAALQRENQDIRQENADIREQNKEANERIAQLEQRLDALIASMR